MSRPPEVADPPAPSSTPAPPAVASPPTPFAPVPPTGAASSAPVPPAVAAVPAPAPPAVVDSPAPFAPVPLAVAASPAPVPPAVVDSPAPFAPVPLAVAGLPDVPGLPRDAEGPVFREPWEAQAFALVLALHERGLFTWREWASALAAQIQHAQAAGDPDHGDTYYHHWLAALETLVATKNLADPTTLARYRHAWDQAAHRTPHGHPIELHPEDFTTHR
jgi:nitrile hydratase accessory protein